MLEISLRRKMVHSTTLEATITCSIIEEEKMIEAMIIMEEMKGEEEMPQVITNKTISIKRN